MLLCELILARQIHLPLTAEPRFTNTDSALPVVYQANLGAIGAKSEENKTGNLLITIHRPRAAEVELSCTNTLEGPVHDDVPLCLAKPEGSMVESLAEFENYCVMNRIGFLGDLKAFLQLSGDFIYGKSKENILALVNDEILSQAKKIAEELASGQGFDELNRFVEKHQETLAKNFNLLLDASKIGEVIKDKLKFYSYIEEFFRYRTDAPPFPEIKLANYLLTLYYAGEFLKEPASLELASGVSSGLDLYREIIEVNSKTRADHPRNAIFHSAVNAMKTDLLNERDLSPEDRIDSAALDQPPLVRRLLEDQNFKKESKSLRLALQKSESISKAFDLILGKYSPVLWAAGIDKRSIVKALNNNRETYDLLRKIFKATQAKNTVNAVEAAKLMILLSRALRQVPVATEPVLNLKSEPKTSEPLLTLLERYIVNSHKPGHSFLPICEDAKKKIEQAFPEILAFMNHKRVHDHVRAINRQFEQRGIVGLNKYQEFGETAIHSLLKSNAILSEKLGLNLVLNESRTWQRNLSDFVDKLFAQAKRVTLNQEETIALAKFIIVLDFAVSYSQSLESIAESQAVPLK